MPDKTLLTIKKTGSCDRKKEWLRLVTMPLYCFNGARDIFRWREKNQLNPTAPAKCQRETFCHFEFDCFYYH